MPAGALWHNFAVIATDCPTIIQSAIDPPLADRLGAPLFKQQKLLGYVAESPLYFSRQCVFIRTFWAIANRHSQKKIDLNGKKSPPKK
ncbi:hypothetical protein [Ensifer aridi]|uniref:hypothetical protein n=1 Tax=Ensifer aridi TaxID=1708715 RepID=UPI00358FAD52